MNQLLQRISRKGNSFFYVLSIGVAALLPVKSMAQATITLGTGTATSSNVPITSNFGYNYSQMIYLGSEITAASGFTGTISKIRFYHAGTALSNSDNWTVYMGATNKTDFTSTTDWIPAAQMTQVFSGTIPNPGPGNWVEITLTTPIAYTAGTNLVVAVDENTPNWGSLASWRVTSTAPVNRSIYYRNDNTNPDPNSPPTATGRATSYPQLQLVLTGPPCTGVPVPGTTNSSLPGVCAGSATNVTLSLQNNYLSSDLISYQWQSFDGTNWNDISGATNATYTFNGLAATTQFQCEVTCGVDSTGTSTPVSVTANALPTIAVTPSSYAICSGSSAGLSASGAVNYTWAPGTGLSSTSGFLVTATPTAPTVYTVTGTDANNCSATSTVFVTPVDALPISISSSVTEFCTPGIPVTLDMGATVPAGISGSGTWEYQWTDTAGTVLQPWSAASPYSTTPATDGNYGFILHVRSSSCPSELPDSAFTNLVVGFGADVEIQQINCNRPTGTFTLQNPYGQTVEDTSSFYDFTSAVLVPANESIYGSTVITGGRVELTPSQTGIKGGFSVFNPSNFYPQDIALNIDFLMTADLPINIFGTGGADGMTWSFGDNANYNAAQGNAHNGFGSKLRVSFDAAGNGSENNNQVGIYLVYGWTAANAFGPASTQTIAYSPNTALWKGRTDVPVSISVSAGGKLTLTVDNTVVFNEIQLPAAYVTADKTTWIHTFSAGTGGDAERHAIDNLLIRYDLSPEFGIAATGATPASWQYDRVFPGLNTGFYDIWIRKSGDSNCSKMIGTYEIENINPIVDLGNDTTICAGDNITIDAGNPGSSYVWNNNYGFNQTVTTGDAGSYIVFVTDTADCEAFDVINIAYAPQPSGISIFSSNTGLDYFFSVINPVNTTQYFWDFGDGTTVNGPSAITHTYAASGQYDVSVVLSNNENCTTDTLTVSLLNTTGINEQEAGFSIYPNPASEVIYIMGENAAAIDHIAMYDLSGKLVLSHEMHGESSTVNVSGLPAGTYILRIEAGQKQSVHRMIVAGK